MTGIIGDILQRGSKVSLLTDSPHPTDLAARISALRIRGAFAQIPIITVYLWQVDTHVPGFLSVVNPCERSLASVGDFPEASYLLELLLVLAPLRDCANAWLHIVQLLKHLEVLLVYPNHFVFPRNSVQRPSGLFLRVKA